MKCIECNTEGVKATTNGQALCGKCVKESMAKHIPTHNVNNLLHYVCHFYYTSSTEGLKKIVTEFYNAKEISNAKVSIMG
jgi:hypothetical protein